MKSEIKDEGFTDSESTIDETNKTTNKKKRKIKPGTVARREIKKFQEHTSLVITKAPFERLIRTYVKKDMRIQASALELIREGVEIYSVDLLMLASRLSQHANRMTVMEKDIKEAAELNCLKLISTKMSKEIKSELSKTFRVPVIKRLCRKAQILRIQGEIYAEFLKYIHPFIDTLISKVIIYTQYSKRKTISTDDVEQAFQIIGRPIYAAV